MQSLQMKFRGKVWVQILDSLPDWTNEDVGRIVYIKGINESYIGGDKKWEPIFLFEDAVKNKHMNWGLGTDIDLINGECIPIYDENTTETNIQELFDRHYLHITNLRNGNDIEDAVLKGRHIDGKSNDGFTAPLMYIEDRSRCFGVLRYEMSVEDALAYLCQRRADSIRLARPNGFGGTIGVSSPNVQNALEDIETYLDNLNGTQITVTMDSLFEDGGACQTTNLQNALNLIHFRNWNFPFTDLIDAPDGYGRCRQVLKTCGQNPDCCDGTDPDGNISLPMHMYWGDIYASEVTVTNRLQGDCKHGSGTDDNLQNMLDNIVSCISNHESRIDSLESRVHYLEYRVLGWHWHSYN